MYHKVRYSEKKFVVVYSLSVRTYNEKYSIAIFLKNLKFKNFTPQ